MVNFKEKLIRELVEKLHVLHECHNLTGRAQDINRILQVRTKAFNERCWQEARQLDLELRDKYPEIEFLFEYFGTTQPSAALPEPSGSAGAVPGATPNEIRRLNQDYYGIVYSMLCKL